MLLIIGSICLVLAAILFAYQKRDRAKATIERMTDQQTKKEHLDIKGIVIGPVEMIFIRYLAIPLIAVLLGSILSLIAVVLTPMYLFGLGQLIFIGVVSAVVSAILIYPDQRLSVPINTVAALSIFGSLYRIYLYEGDYDWWGQKLFIARSEVALRDFTTRKKDSDPEDGFFIVTDIPFNLFDEAPQEVDGKVIVNSLISGVTKNGSPIKSELLITVKTFDPHLALRNQDPGLEIAERARSMFRTCISFFTSLDAAVAKDAMAHLIEGNTIVVAFTRKGIDTLSEGSIARDTGGEPAYFIVKPQLKKVDVIDNDTGQTVQVEMMETLEEATQRTISEYKMYLDTHLSAAMREAVSIAKTVEQNGKKTRIREYVIETRSVRIGLSEILEKNGFRLLAASVGKVVIDDKLLESSVTAEQQTYETTVQVKSAKATAAALKILAESEVSKDDPAYHDKLALAAASDPSSRAGFQRISTDTPLATVGASAALLNTEGNKK